MLLVRWKLAEFGILRLLQAASIIFDFFRTMMIIKF